MLAITVRKHTESSTEDLKKEVLEQIALCEVYLDVNINVSNIPQFMVFARFCFDKEIDNELNH